MSKRNLTAIEKLEAEEAKKLRWWKANRKCEVCGFDTEYEHTQLAHKIPKGYEETFGPEIVHHPLNLVLTCDRKNGRCNDSVLLRPGSRPVEVKALLEEINEAIREEKEDYR